MKLIFYILLVVMIPVIPLNALETEKAVSIYKEKLIIADFKNKSSWKKLGQGLTDDLTSLFAETKRFDIVERDRLKAILKLQLTGIVNDAEAVKIGQLIGANYIIFGSITSADGSHKEETVLKKFRDRVTGQVIYKEYIVTTWEGRVSISVRLVDINTGKVILGKVITGRSSEQQERAKDDRSFLEAIINAIGSANNAEAEKAYHRQMHQKVVNSARQKAAYMIVHEFLKDFPLTGYIISQTEDNDYLVDLGTDNGMNSKVNLKIHGKSEKVIHPVTGEVLTSRIKKLGYLQVVELGKTTSTAKLVKGDETTITPGLKVEVVDPIFIWHRSLSSLIFPGFGQFLEKRWASGFWFLLGETALLGSAYYSYYRSTPSYLEKQNMLDTTDWSISSQGKGEMYDKARSQALIAMWIFIGFEVIVHIWDTINAGYPAEKNRVFTKAGDVNINLAYIKENNTDNHLLAGVFRF